MTNQAELTREQELLAFSKNMDELQNAWEAYQSWLVRSDDSHAGKELTAQAWNRVMTARNALRNSYRVSLECLDNSVTLNKIAYAKGSEAMREAAVKKFTNGRLLGHHETVLACDAIRSIKLGEVGE